jgi:hypothetical protein
MALSVHGRKLTLEQKKQTELAPCLQELYLLP